jgi:hypothetical protein
MTYHEKGATVLVAVVAGSILQKGSLRVVKVFWDQNSTRVEK